MSRRPVAVLLVLVVCVLASAVAALATEPQAAQRVRAAIPAMEFYAADKGTYVGATVAKLRAIDRSIRNVAVKRATKGTYCLQSTLPGPVVHFDGPKGPVRRGPCGVKGAVVPRSGAGSASSDASTAKSRLQAAVFAIQTYAGGNGGYAGMTLAKLQELDAAVQGIRVVWSTARAYCIESGTGAATQYLHGPGKPVAAGRCPTAP